MVILRISHPKSRGKTRLFFFHLAKIFFSPPLSIPSLTSKYLTSSPGNISFVNSSPLGQLLFQSLTYLFYTSGAFLAFIGVIYASYEIWPVARPLPSHFSLALPLYFAGKVGWLMGHMLLLAGPISVACLLTDISLGLVNRFASQLNVYVLAMPIKSGLAAFLLCFYFGLLLSHAPELFGSMRESILILPNLLRP